MMRPGAVALALLAVAVSELFVCHAMFEDQAGSVDWVHQQVGLVNTAVLDPSRPKYALVGTDAGAFASINIRTGRLAWRQVLPERRVDTLLVKNEEAFTLSGGRARLWDGPNMVWEASVGSNGEHATAQFLTQDIDNDKAPEIAVLSGSTLTLLSGHLGTTLWKADLGSKHTYSELTVEEFSSRVYVVGTSGSTLNARSFDIKNGAELSNDSLSPQGGGSYSNSLTITSGDVVVALSGDGSKLHLHRLGTKSVITSPLQGFAGQSISKSNLPSGFIVRGEDGQTGIYDVVKGGVEPSVKLYKKFDSQPRQFDAIQFGDDLFFLTVTQSEKSVSIEVTNYGSGSVVFTHEDEFSVDEHGYLSRVFLSVTKKADAGDLSFRVLSVAEDHSLTLFQTKGAWTREEALASIEQVEFVEYPVDPHLTEATGSTLDVGELVQTLKSLLEAENWMEILRPSAQAHVLVSNQILVMTNPGKFYFLDLSDGSIRNSRFFFAKEKVRPQFKEMFLSSTSIAKGSRPECTIIWSNPSNPTLPTQLVWIDALSGEQKGLLHLTETLSMASLLPIQDSNHRHLLMMVSETDEISVHPDNGESRNLVLPHLEKMYYHKVDKENNRVEGFKLVAGLGQGGGPKGVSQWSVQLPAAEAILDVQSRDHESINSPARVLGDRNILHKYLNRNVVAIITSNAAESVLNCYLIESVTGNILHHAQHRYARGPVLMAQSEHWIVYTYWDMNEGKVHATVHELYEKADYQWGVGTLMSWLMSSSNEKMTSFSSYTSELPDVASQSYGFPHLPECLEVTQTERGLTSRQVLVCLPSGQILAVPKAELDPRRRPMQQMTDLDKEEGIRPYMTDLMAQKTMMLSYNQTIAKLDSIVARPGPLESQSLVFAHGLDYAYFLATPSRSYDVLNDDFNFALLIIFMAALSTVTGVVRYLGKRKEVNRLWK